MRNDICTIPVSEVFEVRDGCPLCRMEKRIEERIIEYIMGDAMMEPDVREETNRIGFCFAHYRDMLNRNGRLQLALMLQTHIDELNKHNYSQKKAKLSELSKRCFICEKKEWGFSRLIETIYRTYENESDFRDMFNKQPMFCLTHYERLVSAANKKLLKKQYGEFLENINRIQLGYGEALYENISKYCNMYDYRNKNKSADFSDCIDAVEKSVEFLK